MKLPSTRFVPAKWACPVISHCATVWAPCTLNREKQTTPVWSVSSGVFVQTIQQTKSIVFKEAIYLVESSFNVHRNVCRDTLVTLVAIQSLLWSSFNIFHKHLIDKTQSSCTDTMRGGFTYFRQGNTGIRFPNPLGEIHISTLWNVQDSMPSWVSQLQIFDSTSKVQKREKERLWTKHWIQNQLSEPIPRKINDGLMG